MSSDAERFVARFTEIWADPALRASARATPLGWRSASPGQAGASARAGGNP
jgi:hypothetical protein